MSAGGVGVLRVLEPGRLALLEDLGRTTGVGIGLPRGGTVDRAGLRLANRLIGNPEDAAGLEALWGGLAVEVLTDTVIAVGGAPAPVVVRRAGSGGSGGSGGGERVEPSHTPLRVRAGDLVRIGRPTRGVRVLVAVAGGLAGDSVVGSVSSSPSAGLGRGPLVAGEVLVGAGLAATSPSGEFGTGEFGTGEFGTGDFGTGDFGTGGSELAVALACPPDRALRVVPGPRDDWFTADARDRFVRTGWLVGAHCDRVGVRLEGPVLERVSPGRELPSEAVIPGSVQVPPDGRPLVFLADHPTTGGYPVIGVVHPADLDVLGQVSPGGSVRFAWWR